MCVVALCFGVVTIGLAFLIYILSDQSVFQLSLRVIGMFVAPICGIFIIGVFFPFVNAMVSSTALSQLVGI